MQRIIVDVMLKQEIRDPQGEAIVGACHRLGFAEVVSVRQGKRFEIEVGGTQGNQAADVTHSDFPLTAASQEPGPGTLAGIEAGPDAAAARIAQLAAELLANPVIEEFTIRRG